MKARRIAKDDEALGWCHDCHNRARIEISFAHRAPIRLCDRCTGFLIENASAVVRKRNGKNGNGKKNHKH